jgi:hypothetical protein
MSLTVRINVGLDKPDGRLFLLSFLPQMWQHLRAGWIFPQMGSSGRRMKKKKESMFDKTADLSRRT